MASGSSILYYIILIIGLSQSDPFSHLFRLWEEGRDHGRQVPLWLKGQVDQEVWERESSAAETTGVTVQTSCWAVKWCCCRSSTAERKARVITGLSHILKIWSGFAYFVFFHVQLLENKVLTSSHHLLNDHFLLYDVTLGCPADATNRWNAFDIPVLKFGSIVWHS